MLGDQIAELMGKVVGQSIHIIIYRISIHTAISLALSRMFWSGRASHGQLPSKL